MKRINVLVNSAIRWSAYKSDESYQAWVDAAVATNLWGEPGSYTVEVLDATAELEQARAAKEGAKKLDLDSHTNNLSNPHQVSKEQIGLGDVDNVSASSLRDRSTHTGTQLASTISDLTASAVSNTPAGAIEATTVQAAINELDTEKQPIGNYITELTGDITATGPGSATATLADSGVVEGTYSLVTVDSKGRVTEGSITRYSYFTSVAAATTLTTYESIEELTTVSLPVGLYMFWFYGTMQSSATNTGVGVRIAPVTATVTVVSAKWNIPQGSAGVSHDFEYDQLSDTTNTTSASSASANADFAVNGMGVFRVTVAGTVAIQTRTETSGQTATLQPDAVFVLELV